MGVDVGFRRYHIPTLRVIGESKPYRVFPERSGPLFFTHDTILNVDQKDRIYGFNKKNPCRIFSDMVDDGNLIT